MGRAENDILGIPRSVRNEIWLMGLRARLRTEETRRIVERAREHARKSHWMCVRAVKRRRKLQPGEPRGRVVRLRRA